MYDVYADKGLYTYISYIYHGVNWCILIKVIGVLRIVTFDTEFLYK